MSEAERIADRIAKNRRIDERVMAGKGGLSLGGIVSELNSRRQRATYGAVAALVGVSQRGLMNGRQKCPQDSWVVAKTNGPEAKRGYPTGYTGNQIDPECYSQFCQRLDNIIENADDLKRWLGLGKEA